MPVNVSHQRAERSVTVELLNGNEIYKENLKGNTIVPIYRIVFYSYSTPLSHWPTDGARLSSFITDWIDRGQRPH